MRTHIGTKLIEAVLVKASKLAVKKLYVEIHTSLKPAIPLYLQAGFKEITGQAYTFNLLNIQMELTS